MGVIARSLGRLGDSEFVSVLDGHSYLFLCTCTNQCWCFLVADKTRISEDWLVDCISMDASGNLLFIQPVPTRVFPGLLMALRSVVNFIIELRRLCMVPMC
jgi:hypothetical protein